jgi:hypothetical protein
LVDEVCNDLGKLPLLEYALKETWRRREGQRLTLNAYGQAGGIDGAVAQRANQIFASLSQAQQAAARRLFVSLVTPARAARTPAPAPSTPSRTTPSPPSSTNSVLLTPASWSPARTPPPLGAWSISATRR